MSKPSAADPNRLPKEAEEDLRKSGLGARYLSSNLETFGSVGCGLRDWIRGPNSATELTLGFGHSIWGSGHRAHDLFMVLARACYLKGKQIKIISLSVLIKELSGADIDASLEVSAALFIHPFYDPSFKENPMTPFQRLAIEDLLVERLDNSKSVFTLSRDRLLKAKAWWSSSFVDRLMVNNQEIGISDGE